MRSFSRSTTKTFPLPSTAMPQGCENCPSPAPADPHLVRNAPHVVGMVVLVVVEEVVALVEVLVVMVVVLVVDSGVPPNVIVPGRLIAPGPGRSVAPSTAWFPVPGMQNVAPSMAGCGSPLLKSPPGEPVSLTHRVAVRPKAPTCDWRAQKRPSLAVTDAVSVVRGVRSTGS